MIGPRTPKTLAENLTILEIEGELGGSRDSGGHEPSINSGSSRPRIHQEQDSADDGGAHGVFLGDQHASSTSLTLEETVPCQSIPSHQVCWSASHFEAALPDERFAPIIRRCLAVIAKSGGKCLEEAHAREALVEAATLRLMTSVTDGKPMSLVEYLALHAISRLDRSTLAGQKDQSHLLALARNLVTQQLTRVLTLRNPKTDSFAYDPLRPGAAPLDLYVLHYLPMRLRDLLLGRHRRRAAAKGADPDPPFIEIQSDEALSLIDGRNASSEWLQEEARRRNAEEQSDLAADEIGEARNIPSPHSVIDRIMGGYDGWRSRSGQRPWSEREANDVDLERPELLSGLAMRTRAFEDEFATVLLNLDTSTLPKRFGRNAANIIRALHLIALRDPQVMKVSALGKSGGADEERADALSLSWSLANRVPELHQQHVASLLQRSNGSQACAVISRFVEYVLSQSPDLAKLADEIWRLRRDWCDLFARRLSLEFGRLPEAEAESRNYRLLRDRLEQRLSAHRNLFLIVAPPTSV